MISEGQRDCWRCPVEGQGMKDTGGGGPGGGHSARDQMSMIRQVKEMVK